MSNLAYLIFNDEYLFEDVSAGAQQAKSMGLVKKPGIGLYGPPESPIATHRIRNGQLIPIVREPKKQGAKASGATGDGGGTTAPRGEKSEVPRTQLDMVKKVQDELLARLATPSPGEIIKAELSRDKTKEVFRERVQFVDDYIKTKLSSHENDIKEFSKEFFENVPVSDIIAEYLEVIGGNSPTTRLLISVDSHPYQNEKTMNVVINDNDIEIQRTFVGKVSRNGRRTLSLYNDVLRAPEEMQGSNIAKKNLGATLRVGDKLGIERVDVTAGLSVGGYAWLKAGATVDNPQALCQNIHDKLSEFFEYRQLRLNHIAREIRYGGERIKRERIMMRNATDPDEKEYRREEIRSTIAHVRMKKKLFDFMKKALVDEDNPMARTFMTRLMYNGATGRISKAEQQTLLYRFVHTELGKAMTLGMSWSGYYDLRKNSKGRKRIEKYIGQFKDMQLIQPTDAKKIPNTVLDVVKDMQSRIIDRLSTPAPGDLR